MNATETQNVPSSFMDRINVLAKIETGQDSETACNITIVDLSINLLKVLALRVSS